MSKFSSGVRPRWILLLVLAPRPEDEALLAQIMADARRAADEIGVAIIGGHTGYPAGLSRPLVAVTALGTASGQAPVRTAGARVGDWVLVTKGIALEGTAILRRVSSRRSWGRVYPSPSSAGSYRAAASI